VPSFHARRIETSYLLIYCFKWSLVSALKGFLKKTHIVFSYYNGSFAAPVTNELSKHCTNRKLTTGLVGLVSITNLMHDSFIL